MKFCKTLRAASVLLFALEPLVTLVSASASGSYNLVEEYSGTTFFDKFNFITYPPPNHDTTWSWSDYVPRNVAHSKGLARALPSSALMFVNDWEVLPFNGDYNLHKTRREAVRIESQRSFGPSLFIFDVAHMPGGVCGTWPALWLLGEHPWPVNGEIDVIEGVHMQSKNMMAMHTTKGCKVEKFGPAMTGKQETWDCDWQAWGQYWNTGCSVEDPRSNSYGTGFNANGGGHYAVEWTPEAVKIWFFPRGLEPSDMRAASSEPKPEGWGTPVSVLTNGQCDINSHFKNMRIVINTAFCGLWAGVPEIWKNSGCGHLAKTCMEFVSKNPTAFTEAYWDIRSIRVFQRG